MSLTILARLLNAATLLQTYQDLLISRVSADFDQSLVDEMTQVSSLLTHLHIEIARATGKSLAGVILSRRQLWLSQTKMPQSVQKPFLDLPVTAGHIFGPGVDAILEQTTKLRKDRETLQTFMGPPAPRVSAQSQWQPRSQFPPTVAGRSGFGQKQQPRPYQPRQQAQQAPTQRWRQQQGNSAQQKQRAWHKGPKKPKAPSATQSS